MSDAIPVSNQQCQSTARIEQGSEFWGKETQPCILLFHVTGTYTVPCVQEEKAYPAAAVKHYHDKPLPSKDMRPVQQKHTINQPK